MRFSFSASALSLPDLMLFNLLQHLSLLRGFDADIEA
jgi:hypothetical protein